jgi:hypothetical protein
LTQLKDARWSQDQQSKRLQRDLLKIREQADCELAERDKLIDKLRAEAQHLLQKELHERAAEHLRMEAEHQERVQLVTLEVGHLRDHLSEKDQLIH